MSLRRGGPGGLRGGPKSGEPADKASAEYWRELKSGDFIGISDAEAFEASLAGGGRSDGSLECEVGELRRFALRGRDAGARGDARDDSGGAELGSYGFIELKREGSGPLYLALVDLPGRFELRLYFIPAGIGGGTRDDWIDRGEAWLFLPPPNPQDFISKDLEYAPYPDIPPIDGRKLVFGRVGPKELYAEALDTEAPSIIVEYEAEASGEGAAANPLLLVLEEGWMKSDGAEPDGGGCLTLMLGKRLKPSEVEYWPS
jgi:hypothetical protein